MSAAFASAGGRPRWLAHEKPALLAAGIGAAAAFAAGALDPVAFALAVGGLAAAWMRGLGWAVARLFQQPRFFTILSAIYLPLFFADLLLSLFVGHHGCVATPCT